MYLEMWDHRHARLWPSSGGSAWRGTSSTRPEMIPRRRAQRRDVLPTDEIDVRAPGEQQPHGGSVPVLAREIEGRRREAAFGVHVRVDVDSAVREASNDANQRSRHTPHQRRGAQARVAAHAEGVEMVGKEAPEIVRVAVFGREAQLLFEARLWRHALRHM